MLPLAMMLPQPESLAKLPLSSPSPGNVVKRGSVVKRGNAAMVVDAEAKGSEATVVWEEVISWNIPFLMDQHIWD
jgi:hypothetical protein